MDEGRITPVLAGITWRKSTFSAYNGNCVEVADLGTGRVAVRDSKAGGAGGILRFDRVAWAAFLSGVKDGRH